jgi:putative chitobiose transport system permease protein
MKIARTTLLLCVTGVAIVPFLWLVSTSFKGAEELFAYPPTFIPSTFVWENYVGLWRAVPLGAYFVNTIVVTLMSVFLNVLLSSLAGFAFARLRFRYRSAMFYGVIAAILIPKEVIILPLYATVLKMHLADSLLGVALPFAVDGLGIFMMRQAFMAIPREIEDAALVDGASPLRLWWNIMLPMTKPTIATLTIFTFIAAWGDFLWPLVVLKSPEHYTLQVGLSFMMGTFVDNFRYVAAGAVLSVLPVFIVFAFMQKHFERGLFAGSTH